MNLKQNPALQEFNQLNQRIEGLYHEIAMRQGVSDSAFLIFRSLLELGDGCSQKDICAASYLNKQTVNSSVRKLIRDGLLRVQPGAGRELRLFFTERGEQFMREKICPIFEAESAVFDEMQPSERAELLRLTEQYLIQFRKKTNQIR